MDNPNNNFNIAKNNDDFYLGIEGSPQMVKLNDLEEELFLRNRIVSSK